MSTISHSYTEHSFIGGVCCLKLQYIYNCGYSISALPEYLVLFQVVNLHYTLQCMPIRVVPSLQPSNLILTSPLVSLTMNTYPSQGQVEQDSLSMVLHYYVHAFTCVHVYM